MAIVLMTQTLLGQREEAFRTALKMSDILKKDKWLSTQSTAWMLNHAGEFRLHGTDGDRRPDRPGTDPKRQVDRLHAAHRRDWVKNTGTQSLHLVVSQSYNSRQGRGGGSRKQPGRSTSATGT